MKGSFKKQLSLLDLTFLGLGSIIGSGWLFASMQGAQMAGGVAWLAWVGGGIAVILIGLCYAELASAMPRAGGFVRYPEYTHGSLVGFLSGMASLLAYSSVAAIEVEAVRGHATYYWTALSNSNGSPTVAGHCLEIGLLVLFFLLNYWSVKIFGRINTIVTFFKFVVPTITIITLLCFFKGHNFTVTGAVPGGVKGTFEAIASGGIVFAFLGFRQAVDFGAEAKNPQRDIPRAIIIAVTLAVVVYILLQVSFLGSVPSNMLTGGWGNIAVALKAANYPFVGVATSLGLSWLSTLLLIDAVISPAGTGNIYLSGTARTIFAWSKNRNFYSIFGKVHAETGVPRAAMWMTFILAVVWTLPSHLDAWQKLVGAVTSGTVMTYLIGPPSMASLRKTMPNMRRPFKLKAAGLLSPLAFLAATCIIYWSGWSTDELLILITLSSVILYFAFMDRDESTRAKLKAHWKSGAWLVVYYLFILVMSYYGSFGPLAHPVFSGPYLDTAIVLVVGLGLYYWAVNSALPAPTFETDTDEEAPVEMLPTSKGAGSSLSM